MPPAAVNLQTFNLHEPTMTDRACIVKQHYQTTTKALPKHHQNTTDGFRITPPFPNPF
jgi:hypothetical protein